MHVMPLHVTVHSHGSAAQDIVRRLAGELGRRDVRVDDAPESDVPAIIVLTEQGDRAGALIADLARARLGRALCVAAGDETWTSSELWRLLQVGAADAVRWSGRASCISEIVARLARWQAIDEVVASPLVAGNLVGTSRLWRELLRNVIEAARFSQSSILLLGQSGTGKELLARLVHGLGASAARASLVVLDCSTIVPDLSGSEFFGHERGAFTGAVAARDGAFAMANGGTLFLDEVGELPLHLQAQLLRVIQEGSFKRVGANSWQETRFRLVCATNRDLQRDVEAGRFRADLYYRIAANVLHVPPLDERREDIVPLAQHFLRLDGLGDPEAALGDDVAHYLVTRRYRGNVRELRQLVGRMRQRHIGAGPITLGCIPADDRPRPEPGREPWPDPAFEVGVRHALALGIGLKRISQTAAEIAIALALAEANGNLQRAAGRLGVTDRALQLRRAASRSGDGSGD
jgi:transcriptional regulator with GAF, ATPase, and Fis domain